MNLHLVPSLVTSFKTVVQYYNPDIDIDTVRIQNISITTNSPPLSLIGPTSLPPAPVLNSCQALICSSS